MSWGFCEIYGEGHLADTLRRELELQSAYLRDDNAYAREGLAFVAEDVTEHTTDQLQRVQDYILQADECNGVVVVLSQVPPGWVRRASTLNSRLFYQVDTIIVSRAVERMLYPEQFIIGCADPKEPLPLVYQQYLALHDCPVLKMSYESAELAKLAINFMLATQIEAANALARAAGAVGADYADVELALRNDARIGPHAYLRPGKPNQHLIRDLETLRRIEERV